MKKNVYRLYDNVQNVYMNSSHSSTMESRGSAGTLGEKIRQARKKQGWTILEMAEKLGRPREWLNRLELGYSEFGEYRPASLTDIQTIIDLLKNNFEEPASTITKLAAQAESEFNALQTRTTKRRNTLGKLTQTEVIVGQKQIVQAILDLISEQHSDAIIRNTGIKSLGNYLQITPEWKHYREALGEFLNKNPNGLFKRVEYAATKEHLEKAKEADVRLSGSRKIEDVHNAKVKFHKHNPLQLHAVIGQREAILALPQTSGQAGSNIAILVRDKIFVEALRVWYDEVLWDAPGPSMSVNFSNFDDSFDEIRKMYGY